MTRKRALPAVMVVVAGMVCGGCQERFTRQMFDTIYIGQPDYAVRRTLGEPESRSDGTWTYVHRRPYYRAVIDFKNNRVISKKWSYDRPARAEE